MATHSTSREIRQFIIDGVVMFPEEIGQLAASKFNITRQAVSRHLGALVKANVLVATGRGKARRWHLKTSTLIDRTYSLGGLEEHIVWGRDVKPAIGDQQTNVLGICVYGLTEMVNNAIDHSEGTQVRVIAKANARRLTLEVIDNGVGIFKKLRDTFEFADELTAVHELAKGKLTTDRDRHSGQGVFFTSRMFDEFWIKSGKLLYSHKAPSDDWLVENASNNVGTRVEMVIEKTSTRTTKSVFDEFSTVDHGFNKTHFPVRLMQYGNENLVSRSQAKRVLARAQQFEVIVLDFHQVDSIGQAFADEIFRVFVASNPDVEIVPVRENDAVKEMIARVKADSAIATPPAGYLSGTEIGRKAEKKD